MVGRCHPYTISSATPTLAWDLSGVREVLYIFSASHAGLMNHSQLIFI